MNVTQRVKRGAAAVAAAVVGIGGAGQARAQDATVMSEVLRRAIVTPDVALLPLPAEVVCGPAVERVETSPRRNFALIVRRTVYPARDAAEFIARAETRNAQTAHADEPGSPEVQLLLWGPKSRRAATVWHRAIGTAAGYARVNSVQWLAGTDTAIAHIEIVPGPVTPEQLNRFDFDVHPRRQSVFLRINAQTGATDTLLTVNGDARLTSSAFHPLAALLLDDGKKVVLVRERGAPTPLAVGLSAERQERVFWGGWLGDKQQLFGGITGRDADDKFIARKVVLDVNTGVISDYQAAADENKPYPQGVRLPYVLSRGTATLSREEASARIAPLWIEGPEPAVSGRTLLAADADATPYPVPLTSAVLYQRQGTLFAVPLAAMKPADLLAKRQEVYKTETLARARRIGNTADNLASTSGNELPPPSDFMRAVMEILGDDPMFQNPATGKTAFTPAYTVTNMKEVPKLSELLIGYLDGPGGRVAIYYGGDTKWEDTPAKP